MYNDERWDKNARYLSVGEVFPNKVDEFCLEILVDEYCLEILLKNL